MSTRVKPDAPPESILTAAAINVLDGIDLAPDRLMLCRFDGTAPQ